MSLDLMCIANMDGHFLRLNPAFETALGFDEAELLNRPFIDFVHPEDQASTIDAMKWLEAGASVVKFENRYLCKDGSYRWLAWMCAPVVEDGQLYAFAHDITERKQTNADIRRINAELDQRVIERTAQLESANRELEAFTYSVSHDLRAPLRGVDSFSRMVIEDYGPKLDDEGRRMTDCDHRRGQQHLRPHRSRAESRAQVVGGGAHHTRPTAAIGSGPPAHHQPDDHDHRDQCHARNGYPPLHRRWQPQQGEQRQPDEDHLPRGPLPADRPQPASDVVGLPTVPNTTVHIAEDATGQGGVEELGPIAGGDGGAQRQRDPQPAGHQAPSPGAAERRQHADSEGE
jgi:PAS domain S-box-containing protein